MTLKSGLGSFMVIEMVPFDKILYDFLMVGHCKCIVPFASYLTLNNIMTLKLMLQTSMEV